jgi:hypothetical protein
MCGPNKVILGCIVMTKLTKSLKFGVNLSQQTMKMRSTISDICLADMQPPSSMNGPCMLSLDFIIMEKLT